MTAARKTMPAPAELLGAMGGLFIGLFLTQMLTAALLKATQVSPPAVLVSGVEALLFTLLAGAALLRPVQKWLAAERRRVHAREMALRRTAERQEFSAELSAALGSCVDEREAHWVLRRALDKLSPDAPVELLLTEPDGDRLARAVSAGSPTAGFGCPVRAAGDCPAIRSGQLRAGASTDLNACRMLAERNIDCHGLCVPVTINGRALGVLHTARDTTPSEEIQLRLRTLAEHSGTRLGLFRAMAATKHAAATDALTSLLNRRALTERVATLDSNGRRYSLIIADIDHFKKLNDTYGHPLGDRALQAFAYALDHFARPEDITARFGGEEFIIILPDADADEAEMVADYIRQGLPQVLQRSSLPSFTASFGIADSRHGRSLDALLAAADSALYAAKHAGRDRAMVAPVDPALRQVC